jgi:hypothetical protein
MKTIANYSLEFGVVMRAVCPVMAGLDGWVALGRLAII